VVAPLRPDRLGHLNLSGYSPLTVEVSLIRSDESLLGMVGKQRVDLLLDFPSSRAGFRGDCFGAKVGGCWQIGSNPTTSILSGSFSASTTADRCPCEAESI